MGKSPSLAIVLAGTRLFGLRMLALLLTLPCDSSVGAVTFAFSGFKDNSLHLVPDSNWIFNTSTGCFQIKPAEFDLLTATSGRFLYPDVVQIIDPGSTTVKSFSTSFIYQLQTGSTPSQLGSGLAFIVVPDNVTLGAPGDFMGLITSENSETGKNYESDDHTLGVELDTYMNSEFNDTNNNHIGINLASMNSTYSFEPVYSLASSSAILYQQIWIDYFSSDSRMHIYYANYKEGKPETPQGSQSGLDLSLLKESMFVGFSSANKIGGFDVPYVCAWSFSNDGISAPSIVIAQDATPGAPPPPPNGLVAAPLSLPPLAPIPSHLPVSTRSSAPGISLRPAPLPAPSSSPPPLRAPNPSPFNPPNPPANPGGTNKMQTWYIVAIVLCPVIFGLCVFVLCCWLRYRSHPLRTFVCHAGGLDGSEKNFPTWLVQTMRKHFKSSNITFFFDRDNVGFGEFLAERIFEELARFDVGLVVVTEAFFKGKWPMTELIAFVEAHTNDPTGRLRVLPLFYKLTPEDVREHLREETWEADWEAMREGSHPLEVDKCRNAVNWLCRPRGIVYRYNKRDHDSRYIEEICMALDEILCQERSFASYLRGAFTCFLCST